MRPAEATGDAFTPLGDEALTAFCSERIEKGSKSFAGASRLFDPETRASAIMLYAWCRHCDDVIDGQELGFAPDGLQQTATRERLDALRSETLDALEGRANAPVYQALQVVAQRHNIDRRHPMDLIEGFAMDVSARTYDSFDDTLAYCYHVAGVVGVMMAQIMGVQDRPTLARASDLGIAFQLTNISRDTIPDARAGRVYLPADLLQQHGLVPRPEIIADPDNRAQVAAAVADLLDEADRYYRSAGAGIGQLPLRSAWAIATARRVYRDIGGIVRARGPAAWDRRASTGKATKIAGMTAAYVEAASKRGLSRLTPQRNPHRQAPREDLWLPPFLREEAPALSATREPAMPEPLRSTAAPTSHS